MLVYIDHIFDVYLLTNLMHTCLLMLVNAPIHLLKPYAAAYMLAYRILAYFILVYSPRI